jgi:hypothetical protein
MTKRLQKSKTKKKRENAQEAEAVLTLRYLDSVMPRWIELLPFPAILLMPITVKHLASRSLWDNVDAKFDFEGLRMEIWLLDELVKRRLEEAERYRDLEGLERRFWVT